MKLNDEDWQRLFSVNLDAVWKASQVVGKQMAARGTGSIINIGSISGLIVNRPQWHYALWHFEGGCTSSNQVFSGGVGKQRHPRNAIAPGYVKTEIASTEYEDYAHYWRDEVPEQRYATPEEIAPIALLLASDASTFVTGSVFVVDGGYTLW